MSTIDFKNYKNQKKLMRIVEDLTKIYKQLNATEAAFDSYKFYTLVTELRIFLGNTKKQVEIELKKYKQLLENPNDKMDKIS